MSDSIEDLVKRYNDNVHEKEHSRSIGLFTIPEYPELEAERGMWSAALDAILTTLRYLAPATLLTIFWGQQSFLFKILKHIDSAFRSIVFSSEEQKQAVLKWLADAGPVRVEHLDTVWRHGWILCGVLDAALPGACAGHPPIRLSIKHAQTIAEHYLGVEPVFSRQELESNNSLSRHQEWKLASYLDHIRQAISRLTPPVSKPVSQRTSPETTQCTLDYVAKGSGLTAVQINNKAHFKIYPTAQQSLDPGEVTILIRGPRDTYGMAVTPPILGKAQMIRQKVLGLQSKQTYTENILPVTQGAVYLRNYGKNDMNKTYYIPKAKYDIEIEIDTQPGYVKVSYTVKLEGKYIISIASRGQNIAGSPFSVTATNNIVSILEKDSFSLEDGEEIDIVDIKNDRKVVLRIVDFVTEKMLLKENGTLEKISDEEAKMLMVVTKEHESLKIKSETCTKICKMGQKNEKINIFKSAAFKILTMYKVCKIFRELIINKQLQFEKDKKESCMCSRNQQDIPDIVNSTFTELHSNPYIVSEMREKFIVPECISVSLVAEKSKTFHDEIGNNTISDNINLYTNIPMTTHPRPDTPDSLEVENCSPEDECSLFNISSDRTVAATGNNPFLNEIFEENYAASNNFGTFVASEYETNNSQNEETNESSIKIIIDPNFTPSPITSLSPTLSNKNPFIDPDVLDLERPKTPVYKIISGETINRGESVFIDPKCELLTEEELENAFVNPFFMHQFQTTGIHQTPITDFIVGAPVSLPPIIRTITPEPNMKSLIVRKNENTEIHQSNKKNSTDVDSESMYSTSHCNKLSTPKEHSENNFNISIHSLQSSLTETIDNSNASTASENQFELDQNDSNRNVTPRKDMWDSAYVSIDDSNSSPDSNNNENTNVCNNHFSSHDKSLGSNLLEITNMGPAEREIWQTCGFDTNMKFDTNRLQEDMKYKWEVKRPMFTPIIEESDRSMSLGAKSMSISETCVKHEEESNTVSVAFAELNDMYQEYISDSEITSTSIAGEDNMLNSMEVKYITQTKDNYVDSASEVSDVKRHNNDIEGMISEVQANVTESISVSQILHDRQNYSNSLKETGVETQFCKNKHNNIVLEKKKYWDERIREIEAKAQEVMVPKKRRTSSKQLKHDSLSKRKGKQMIKNFLNAGDYSQVTNIYQPDESSKTISTQSTSISTEDVVNEPVIPNEKLVTKWKRYWDDKLEVDQVNYDTNNHRINLPKNKLPSPVALPNPELKEENEQNETNMKTSANSTEVKSFTSNQNIPIKQELPEEIFKAFETSPKRFFGTSRKQILNKLDIFLGNPDINIATTDTVKCQDSGLVSSRISLFHNMSNTEELPWVRRKTQSLHNISQRRESEKSVTFSQNKSILEELQTDVQLKSLQGPVDMMEKTIANAMKSIHLKTEDTNWQQNLNHETSENKACETPIRSKNTQLQKDIQDDNEYPSSRPKAEALRKKSFSKSEMDIFNKGLFNDKIDELDKHKSCDELPKINVKSFISLYESVSKSNDKFQPAKRVYRTSSGNAQMTFSNSITSDAVPKRNFTVTQKIISNSDLDCTTPGVTPTHLYHIQSSDRLSNTNLDMRKTPEFCDVEIAPNDSKKRMYLSLSDIELEIIENKSSESSPEREIKPEHIEYKNRFKLAKEYFQSLEEIREPKKPRQLNECELLLHKQSLESLENEQTMERPQKRVKKNIKSNSLPSSEIAKAWNQFQERRERCASEENPTTKLIKISEKFNVDDLFTDVTEGKLSRQGSLRGIPHKKAVLEAFRSMENVSDTTPTSYEIVDSNLTNFSNELRSKNAQRYLSEYPYLPKTDPSHYHSRVDVKASGLISLKELKKKPRRNSVPDLRLNTNFTANL